MSSIQKSEQTTVWGRKALTRLIVPLIIEQVLAVLAGTVDTLMVASVGEGAVSGISLVDAVNYLLITAFSAISAGGAVVASQYLGRKDYKRATTTAHQLVYASMAISIFLTILSLVFHRGAISFIYGKLEHDVMENAVTYFWYSALSFPFIALYSAGSSIFRSMGNTKTPLAISAVANVLNIIGNSIFIFGFGMGVAGAAISTLISRIVSAIAVFIVLLRPNPFGISLYGISKIKMVPDIMKRILKIGIPNGFESSLFQIGKLLVAGLISSLGTAAIAGNSIAGRISEYGVIPAAAINLAIITIIGQCIGAGNYDEARRLTKKLVNLAHISALALGGISLLFCPQIVSLFNLSDEASRIAYHAMFICFIGYIFWPRSFSTPCALRAAGDIRYTSIVSILSMWVFRIAFSYLFVSLGYGVTGVWMAAVIDWIVRGIFYTARWKSNKWEKMRVI